MEPWPMLVAIPLGALVGATGVGAFLLVPVLLLAGFGPATAIVATLAANLGAAAGMVAIVVRQRAVDGPTFAHLSAGTAVGVALGGTLLGVVDDRAGTLVAAALLAASGAAVIAHALRRADAATVQRGGPGSTVLVGVLAQITSIFAGVGGPAFTIPSLMALGMRQALAIGTAIAHGLVVSGVGIVTVVIVRGLTVASLDALVPAGVLAGVAIAVRSRVRPTSRRRWLEAAVGLLALLGAWLALASVAT